MPAITLPDGSVRRFDGPVTGTEVAAAIGPGLAKAALAMSVDGKLSDLAAVLDRDAAIRFVTRKDPEALELIRHDAAHVLAEAVQELFPGTQVTIGPPIENGFYYDFARNEPFTPGGLPARSRRRCARSSPATPPSPASRWTRDEAIRFFEDKGERFKVELIQDLPRDRDRSPSTARATGSTSAAARTCARTGDVGDAFKLMKVAGAYWRGDHRNPVLSPHLRHRLARPEGARRLPPPARGSGAPRPPPHRQGDGPLPPPGGGGRHRSSGTRRAGGSTARVEAYMRRRLDAAGYQEVRTPQLVDRRLWEASRPLGEVPRAHVHRHRRGRVREGPRARAEADELPLPRADLQPGRPLLPRAAAAHGGVRLLPPLRALRRAARHHAGPRLHPGRRAHLLHRGADRRRDGALRGAALLRSTATSASRISA